MTKKSLLYFCLGLMGVIVLSLMVFAIFKQQKQLISQKQAVALVQQQYPELKDYPNDELAPLKAVKTEKANGGWYMAFTQEGGPDRFIISAKCFFVDAKNNIISNGEYKPGSGDEFAKNFSVKTCLPISDASKEKTSFGNDQVEKSITDYLLTQKYFSWKTTTDSRNFCVIENLDPTEEGLFPLYVWVRCGEFVLQNGKLKELSGISVPAKINYPNELSFYDLSKFSYEAPRDGSLYSKDIKTIFPSNVQKRIADFDSKNINSRIEVIAVDKSKFCPDYGDCNDYGLESRKCDKIGDCMASCAYGCVSKKWAEGRADCEAIWENFECECIDDICQRK